MPPIDTGLSVHGTGLLTGRGFADLAQPRNVLVAAAFEQEQRNVFLGRRQTPALELLVDLRRETSEQILCFVTPRDRVVPAAFEVVIQIRCFRAGAPGHRHDAHNQRSYACQGRKRDASLYREVRCIQPFAHVGEDVYYN